MLQELINGTLSWIGLQSEAVAVWAPSALWTIVFSLGSTLIWGETNIIWLCGQNCIRRSKCLTPRLSLQGVGFLFLCIWKRCVFRQTGVVVCYCTGSIARRGALTFCSIQSTGWHGRINIRWLDDEVLTIVFISTLSWSKGGKFFLACQGLHKPPVTCGRLHIDPRFNISDSWFSGLSTDFHPFLFCSSQDGSSAPQFLFYFSTKSVGFERQGGCGKAGKLAQGAEYLSCFLERATGQILPPMQLLWEGHKGLRPTAGTCTRALVPARKIHSARSLMESQGHSSRVTDHCLQNEYSMVSSELQPCKTLFRFWLIGLLIGKRMAAPSKL